MAGVTGSKQKKASLYRTHPLKSSHACGLVNHWQWFNLHWSFTVCFSEARVHPPTQRIIISSLKHARTQSRQIARPRGEEMRHQPRPSSPGDTECTILSLLFSSPPLVSNSKSWKAHIRTVNWVCPGISLLMSSLLISKRTITSLSLSTSLARILTLHFFPLHVSEEWLTPNSQSGWSSMQWVSLDPQTTALSSDPCCLHYPHCACHVHTNTHKKKKHLQSRDWGSCCILLMCQCWFKTHLARRQQTSVCVEVCARVRP